MKKAIPLDLNLEEQDALRNEESAFDKADAQAKLAKIIAKHAPPGGWPVQTTEAANEASAISSRQKSLEEALPIIRHGAQRHVEKLKDD